MRYAHETPRYGGCPGIVTGLRDHGDIRERYIAQSKMTRTISGVAPLPSAEEAQRLLSEPSRCMPQATRIERAAARIMSLFDRSST